VADINDSIAACADNRPTTRDLYGADVFVPCCYGSAHDGPDGCTCWVPVHDSVQAPIDDTMEPEQRTKCCGKCAYRNGSPEREAGRHDELIDHVYSGDRFYCHDGMRQVIEYRHPDGRTAPADAPGGEFVPHVENGVAYKADGSPADICAGWGAHRKAIA
jgi:hypothetical protein